MVGIALYAACSKAENSIQRLPSESQYTAYPHNMVYQMKDSVPVEMLSVSLAY